MSLVGVRGRGYLDDVTVSGFFVFQGIEVARRVRDEERGGKAKLVIIGNYVITYNRVSFQ